MLRAVAAKLGKEPDELAALAGRFKVAMKMHDNPKEFLKQAMGQLKQHPELMAKFQKFMMSDPASFKAAMEGMAQREGVDASKVENDIFTDAGKPSAADVKKEIKNDMKAIESGNVPGSKIKKMERQGEAEVGRLAAREARREKRANNIAKKKARAAARKTRQARKAARQAALEKRKASTN